ncbi:hypothetical protein JCM3770_001938 [Rhodotorula araucariae]
MASPSAASTPYQRGPGTPILGLPATTSGVASPRPPGQISSAADLTASVRRTTGDRPPPLVGCSVTLIGDAVYVFGGRLVPTRTMVGTLYRLDLASGDWAQMWPPKEGQIEGGNAGPGQGPRARYFHSACAWGDKLVIFGGEGYGTEESPSSVPADVEPAPEVDPVSALRTLDDICMWDTASERWLDGATSCAEGVERPAARYAHLGVVTSARVADGASGTREKAVMLVMGGQDITNTYLHSVNVLDLETMTWILHSKWDRHVGTYRAVVASPRYSVVPTTSIPSPLSDDASSLDHLIQLAHSTPIDQAEPEHLVLYSNFNFSQVRRDLDLLESPLSTSSPLASTALSSCMTGASLPPGLRFPTGTIIGRHLLVFGTFLSSAANNFSIWALDLGPAGAKGVGDRIARGETLEWMRIDPGSVLARGSWNRAVAWGNTVVVLGDRERDIAADYDHRQTNFAHLAVVDLESFGIYQPPSLPLPLEAQAFGLSTLSQPYLADFEIVCSDGKRLGCSRQILVERWPWFKAKLDNFRQRASSLQSAQGTRGTDSSAVPTAETSDQADGSESSRNDKTSTGTTDMQRLTPRTLDLPEPASVVQAFLQYLHTLTLCTPLQLHPPVLAALVVFARTYNDDALRAWCVHALHGVLEGEAAAAPLVYEAATVAGCTALQIRALRTMLSNPGLRARPSPRPPSVTQGSFDSASRLFGDGDDDPSACLLGSSEWCSGIDTGAVSVSSRSSYGVKSSLGSTASHGSAPWSTRLETQVEEHEPVSRSTHVQAERRVDAVAAAEATLVGRAAMSQGSESTSTPARQSRFSLVTSLLSKHRKRRPHGAVDESASGAEDGDHWAPSFFDTVKGGRGSVRSPLSTRRATAIPQEILEQLDLDALTAPQPLVSPPCPVSGSLEDEEESFVHPRPAPTPSLLAVSSSSAGSLSTTSLVRLRPKSANGTETRRHSLDHHTARLFSPQVASGPAGASAHVRSSSCSASRALSDRSSVSSSASIGMDRLRSSSGESATSIDELATPPLPSVAVFPADAHVIVYDPRGTASHAVPLDAPVSTSVLSLHSSLHTNTPRAKGSVVSVDKPSCLEPVPFAHGATAPLTAASLAAASRLPVVAALLAHASAELLSKPRSAKAQHHALEVELGTRVLAAAGASATEIRLRARSVGFQVRRRHEEETKRRAAGAGGKGEVTGRGESASGTELPSRFSIDE